MRSIVSLLILAAWPVLGDPTPSEDLAEQIRNARPEGDSQSKGTLIIRAGGQTTNRPLSCKVVCKESAWETVYDIAATNGFGAEQLIVIHRTNAPNEYLYARAASASEALPKPTPISAEQAADTALGGSDFSAADLGLEFLHWPQQQQLKGEMRLGQPCYVLESRDPEAKSIARVVSYIDKESDMPLVANGYDAQGHLVKEFSLHGSSFKKVHGQWQLQKMNIRDDKKHSRTELKFDLLDK